LRVLPNLRLSLRAFATHRIRTALAISGTAVGVAGVLVLTAVGEGARTAVQRRIESLGRNMLVVSAGKIESRAGREVTGKGWRRTLKASDAAALLAGSPDVMRAAPAQDRGMVARFGAIQSPATVVGTTPEWRIIRQFPLEEGRFFTAQENEDRARVAVLGAAIRRSLLGDSADALGRTIRIGPVPFEIIGVLCSKGVSIDGNATEDDRIFVPLSTAQRRLFNLDYIKFIYLEAADPARMMEAEADAAAILRARHRTAEDARDDFAIQNQRTLLDAELATQASFRRLVVGLGFLSLVVGGVGILSMMQLSVRERRPEIGLRMAVGARRADIGLQFLAEALLLAAAGGVIGLLLGLGTAKLVSSVTSWDARISERTLTVALVSVGLIGVAAGVTPAWRAARLDPVEALSAD
jgi:putative ABC transport system permease protein